MATMEHYGILPVRETATTLNQAVAFVAFALLVKSKVKKPKNM